MRIAVNAEDYSGYSRFLPVHEIDPKSLREAKAKFARYRIQGVVTCGRFEDTGWGLTNEVGSFRFCFSLDRSRFEQGAGSWIGCTADCFCDCVKAYLVFLLGELALSSLCSINRELMKLSGQTFEEAALPSKASCHILSFLAVVPGNSEFRDSIMERLEEAAIAAPWKRKQRRLSDFRDYLRFHEEMARFWAGADLDGRLHYFPLYLWWNLTAILPLRATEFLLLPRYCLREENGRPVLSIRRTRMKKGAGRIAYRIDTDYEIREYEILPKLAEEIHFYQEATRNRQLPALGTLFVPEGKGGLPYFDYRQMNALLRRFCAEQVDGAGFPIHLGDTRHLAMINLILSGGSPVICRELAGHEDINISSGYYANLSSVVDCAVYEYYRRGTGSTKLEGSLMFPVSIPEKRIRVSDGWCDVPEVRAGCISECLKNYGKSGQIGNCRECRHFYPDRGGLQMELLSERKQAVDEDGLFLIQMIELVRRGSGYEEDIGAALLRLQASSCQYAAALCRKYEQEDGYNGKAKKD